MSSTACWTSDARTMSAASEPKRGSGRCVLTSDPCTTLAQALRLKLSGLDAKWRELETILDDPIMLDQATGLRRKILIFTEPKDTLEYLHQKIAARVGDPAAVVVIHGGI